MVWVGVCVAVRVMVHVDLVTGVMEVSMTQVLLGSAVVKGVTWIVRVMARVDVHVVSSHGSSVGVGVSSGQGSEVMVIFLVI